MLNSLDAGSHSDISYAADPKMEHGKSTPVVRMIPQSCIPMLQVLPRLIYVDTDFTGNWNKETCLKQIETQYTPEMGTLSSKIGVTILWKSTATDRKLP